MNEDLICILGPTASGKTKYAVNLAHRIGGEIISADSRQVYKGMDIGTGKDLAEYTVDGISIPYHLIDIVDAGEKYNLFRYQQDFLKVYSEIRERGKVPVLCGGTGLYIDAVTKGYSMAEVPENKELRSELEQLTMEELVKMLDGMKSMHNTTDVDTKKRAIRAIEIEKYQQSHPEMRRSEGFPLNTRFIGMLVSREERVRRIDKRLKERLEGGMIEEVRRLLEKGISPEDLIYYGLEYKFVTLFIIGKLTYSEMESQLATAIHQFAKRQMTWFRGMERRGVLIEWVEP
ncbi:MAG: tRNA (adenosine(37)-N6)-dimethylallyltransferase MiaA [Bacteroidales bacterium]|nr:tRNA (adenosine(37)-N6)-dimethylallyltransferase MiaA [Bacteroidales bacterium]